MTDTRISLILRLPRSADTDAWRQFVEIYEPLIRRYARRRGLQEADIQDLTQRVFTSVASAVERWKPDRSRGRFRAWLFRIARNHLINQAASGRRERPQGGTTQLTRLQAEVDPRAELLDECTLEYRRAAFESAALEVKREVKAATWEAFMLTAVQGHDCDHAAEQLGISVGAVYIARSRVLARLRKLVQEMEADDALHG
ncbi:MAG: sigma-70 family RNA polymerase sigma factor [Pirellulales bacterium]